MGCATIVTIFGGILLLYWYAESPQTLIFGVITLIFIGIFIYINDRKEAEKRAEEQAKKSEEERIAHKRLIEDNKIPNDSKIIWYKNGHTMIKKNKFNMYVWIDDDKLNFFDKGTINNVGKFEIPLKEIEYYEIRGEIHRETQITGGGISGGGSSIGGAIAGGLIAGGAGAIIGSRKEIKSTPITSKTVTKDERETFLNFFIDDKKHSMFFSYEGYNILLDLIPDKSYTNISNNYIINQVNKDENEKVINQIKRLADLRDEGILTEDEFQGKKKELLSKI